jgi:hypothetical protein
VKTPQFLKLFFLGMPKRPKEALGIALKKSFKNEELQRKAGLGTK